MTATDTQSMTPRTEAEEQQISEDQHKTEEPKQNKKGLQKLNRVVNRISKPLNKAAGKLGCEAFNPQELDMEIEKCARILRSFCVDGFYEDGRKSNGKKDPRERKALRKIPKEVIRNAKGLAIFTTFRIGASHLSGSNGCGVLVKKLPDGSWSPPSGIHIATMGAGLVFGIDVYDCVAVINNDKAMESMTRVRGTIGGELSAAAGPLGGGMTLDSEVTKRPAPVWTYMKNRGFYIGAHLDGTIYIERTNENPRFYGKEGVRHADILNGQVQPPPGTASVLWETLQAAEGSDYNPNVLPPPPSYDEVVSEQGDEKSLVEEKEDWNERGSPSGSSAQASTAVR